MKALLYITYVAVLIVMGAATLVESSEGTPYVHQHIYGTWWFAALWAVLALVGAAFVVKSKERRVPVLLLHASFLVILAGALLTHLTGRSGTIHLRLGEPQSIAEIEHGGKRYLHRLNFAVELTDFKIVEDEEGRVVDYKSEFDIGDEHGFVSMNRIYKHGTLRFYQASYDYDQRGSTLMINRDPWGIPVTYCGYGLLFVSFVWVVARGKRQSRQFRLSRQSRQSREYRYSRYFDIFENFRHFREFSKIVENLREFSKGWLIPLFALLLTAAWCVYYFVLDGSWAQIPVLRHPLLIFHVVIIILAYALLLIQTLRSAWALTHSSQFSTAMHSRAVGESEAVIVNCQLLKTALCLLSIGIFLGAIWANISWGNYWSWDSKEVWALITLMIYAVPVHRRSLPAFNNPRLFHVYMLVAFLAVLMTYFGVNYLLTGLHSYN